MLVVVWGYRDGGSGSSGAGGGVGGNLFLWVMAVWLGCGVTKIVVLVEVVSLASVCTYKEHTTEVKKDLRLLRPLEEQHKSYE